MTRIQRLSPSVSEQIAAGEVVEKPASVVKELVENSIDAKSGNIQVIAKKAGKESIRVIDDGNGIHPDDIELAFSRHATSKIYSRDDLNRIKTLGFRGEALASIAAVSRVEVKTRQHGEKEGVYLLAEAGEIKKTEPTGCPEGTDIEVKDLFYNTPARLKFLKKDSTEIAWIQDVVNKMSLSYPNIRFKLMHGENRLLQTTGQNNLLEVISRVYGYQTAKKLIAVSHTNQELELHGYISRPELTRSNRGYQTVYINKRYVNNNLICKSMEKSYHTLLPKQRYPIAVLKLWLPEAELDVNVHPAKIQVRFSDPKKIADFVEKAVSKALVNENLIFPSSLGKQDALSQFHSQPQERSSRISNTSRKSMKGDQLEITGDLTNHNVANRQKTDGTEKASETKENYQYNKDKNSVNKMEDEIKNAAYKYGEIKEELEGKARTGDSSDVHGDIKIDWSIRRPDGETELTIYKLLQEARVVGQFFSSYWLLEFKENLYFIDQHAAHERVNYYDLMEKYRSSGAATQQVIPYTLELDSANITAIQDNMRTLSKCGIEMELFGENTLLVRSVPLAVKEIFNQEAILDLIDQLADYPEEKLDIETVEEILITTACKKSVKANQKMETDDFLYLLNQLAYTPTPFTCPHGRPTMVKMTKKDIEKLFYRS